MRRVLAAVTLLSWMSALFAAGEASPAFRKIQLTDKFWSEGAAVADINRDGHMDVVAVPFWYEGPAFKKRHEIFPATQSFTLEREGGTKVKIEGYEGALGKNNAYSDSFLTFARDLSGDDWPDVMVVGFPGKETWWYENPGRAGVATGRHWKRYVAYDVVGNESPTLVDLFDDGRPVILCMSNDVLGYAQMDPRRPKEKWTFHAIASLPLLREFGTLGEKMSQLNPGQEPVDIQRFVHGLGYGDVNGDGRQDVLEPDGWWEQHNSARGGPAWRFHQWPFLRKRPPSAASATLSAKPSDEELKRLFEHYRWPYMIGGSQMYAYDVNGDGLSDVIASLDAHGYGLAWFEQSASHDSSGEIQFKPHFIMEGGPGESRHGVNFTQLHGVDLVDVDGDGLKDIVTGKRFWAHGPDGPDPETRAPAVLYWFELVRNGDKSADFIPHLIDNDSGVGVQVLGADINGDRRTDIAVSNKKGAFVFIQGEPR